jgi:hypothetical protein
MLHPNVQPPFSDKFSKMDRKEIRAYYRWFIASIPQGVAELAGAVKRTTGFESWDPDYSVESLDILGEWYVGQIARRERTKDEIEAIKQSLPYSIDVPEWELSDATFSWAVDMGMYFSQVLIKNHPSLQWNLPLGSKRFVHYGQPVLAGFGQVSFNPVHVATVFAYGALDKKYTGKRLRELYHIWSGMVAINERVS